MNSERKIAYLQKQLANYKEVNGALRSERDDLVAENNRLKRRIEEMNNLTESLFSEAVSNREEHAKRISELSKIKKSYLEATKKVKLLEKEYKQKMDTLIGRIKKRS